MTKILLPNHPVERLRRRIVEKHQFRKQQREHDLAMSIPGVAAEHDAMVRRSGHSCPFCG